MLTFWVVITFHTIHSLNFEIAHTSNQNSIFKTFICMIISSKLWIRPSSFTTAKIWLVCFKNKVKKITRWNTLSLLLESIFQHGLQKYRSVCVWFPTSVLPYTSYSKTDRQENTSKQKWNSLRTTWWLTISTPMSFNWWFLVVFVLPASKGESGRDRSLMNWFEYSGVCIFSTPL